MDFLKFDFPLGLVRDTGSKDILSNHKGALQFLVEMEHILNKKLATGVTIGPFKNSLFNDATFSP